MIDNGRSADQIRNAAGVGFSDAQVAIYMASGAATGWSLSDFVDKTRIPFSKARAFAFRFGVKFPDYNPVGQPKCIEWRKAKKGWELLNATDVIGSCTRQGDGRYLAQALGQGVMVWDARTAMRALSELLDGLSPELFDGRPIRARLTDADGKTEEVIFGTVTEEIERCRRALAFGEAA